MSNSERPAAQVVAAADGLSLRAHCTREPACVVTRLEVMNMRAHSRLHATGTVGGTPAAMWTAHEDLAESGVVSPLHENRSVCSRDARGVRSVAVAIVATIPSASASRPAKVRGRRPPLD